MPTTKTFYTFSELSSDQQKAYFESNKEKFEPYEDWYEGVYESYKDALELLGFCNLEFYFSGFYSQGDGAQFNGTYCYEKGALKKVKKEFPRWAELHEFCETLQAIQKTTFYTLQAKITHSGRYYHEFCTDFIVEIEKGEYTQAENDFVILCRDFMKTFYKDLEKEYDYLCSWENVKECPENYDFIGDIELNQI